MDEFSEKLPVNPNLFHTDWIDDGRRIRIKDETFPVDSLVNIIFRSCQYVRKVEILKINWCHFKKYYDVDVTVRQWHFKYEIQRNETNDETDDIITLGDVSMTAEEWSNIIFNIHSDLGENDVAVVELNFGDVNFFSSDINDYDDIELTVRHYY